MTKQIVLITALLGLTLGTATARMTVEDIETTIADVLVYDHHCGGASTAMAKYALYLMIRVGVDENAVSLMILNIVNAMNDKEGQAKWCAQMKPAMDKGPPAIPEVMPPELRW
jgi:hypothetical protein